MPDTTISGLPAAASANASATVAADNAAATLTEKVTLGQIAALAKTTTVVALTYASTITTNASAGDIFDLTLTGNTTLANPTNPVDGKTLRWRIRQDGPGGRTVALGNKFVIPSSATSPLAFSNAGNAMDILAATYHAGRDKWDVIAFVPGY